jgi:hypothetical protein
MPKLPKTDQEIISTAIEKFENKVNAVLLKKPTAKVIHWLREELDHVTKTLEMLSLEIASDLPDNQPVPK